MNQTQHGIYIQPHAATTILKSHPVESCIFIIFGGSGDLTARKIVPALHSLSRDGLLPKNMHLIVFSRSVMSLESLLEKWDTIGRSADSLEEKDGAWDSMMRSVTIVRGNYDDIKAYELLRQRLGVIESGNEAVRNRLFYLATPAISYPLILTRLRQGELIHENEDDSAQPWSRIVIEKPFGVDRHSAQQLNTLARNAFSESQIYRIDHYLGKETVQNISVLRFGNSIFEPIWNRKYISHVEVTVAEQVGTHGRSRYYDQAGVIRDMLQNHLLQLLALIAMEQPSRFAADDIRDEKAKVLRSLRQMTRESLSQRVILGQYATYRSEEGVAPDSRTPTYVGLRVEISNWRWQGVPFYLRTGKCLRSKTSRIVIHFHPIPLCLFGLGESCDHVRPNVLVIRVQPDEGTELRVATKVPGEDLTIGTVSMNFSYSEAFGKRGGDAYERLLLDVMRGNQALFARDDEIELAWEYVDPILEAYEDGKNDEISLFEYPVGSDGPAAARSLLSPLGHEWSELT